MTDLHTLLSLAVLPASSSQLNDCFVPKFKSESIGQRVLEQYGHLEPKQARRLLRVYRDNPQSGITAGWIFEGLVHGVLCGQMSSDALCGPLVAMQAERGGTAPRFVAEQEFDSATQHLLIRPRSYTAVDLSGATFALAPHDKMEGLFYVSKAANNPLFDPFFVELRTDPLTAIVWIFQATIAKDYEGSSRGYPLIDAIKTTVVAHAPKSTRRRIRQCKKNKSTNSSQMSMSS